MHLFGLETPPKKKIVGFSRHSLIYRISFVQVLRSSMIELINEDYADFVNLSTNLVGLDTTIQQLQQPLAR